MPSSEGDAGHEERPQYYVPVSSPVLREYTMNRTEKTRATTAHGDVADEPRRVHVRARRCSRHFSWASAENAYGNGGRDAGHEHERVEHGGTAARRDS